jgi:hypothetical protein
MVEAILVSKVDCLTCYWQTFRNESELASNKARFTYIPIGACLEAGIYENVFGSDSFIINKEVFLNLGGFNDRGNEAVADWEFFASLLLAGYTLDLIPSYLVINRQTKKRLFHSLNFQQHSQILAPYLNTMPLWQQRFMINAIGDEKTNRYEILTPEALKLPPSIFKLLRRIYLNLSDGGLENKSPNLLAKVLNFIALQITPNTKN